LTDVDEQQRFRVDRSFAGRSHEYLLV
jgi:hypothetical protein